MSARGRVRKEGLAGIDTFETLPERMTAVRILDRKFSLRTGQLAAYSGSPALCRIKLFNDLILRDKLQKHHSTTHVK